MTSLDKPGKRRVSFTAFISYSHQSDVRLATALRTSLQRFAKSWYRLRACRIFLDKSTLASSVLWKSIRHALDESEHLLLLASPQSAKSDGVQLEIDHWLTSHSSEQLLIVLTQGEIAWDTQAADFDWNVTTALPASLRGVFGEEPLYLDLRGIETDEQASMRNVRFRGAVVDLSATLRHREKDELDGLDVREHRKVRRLAWSAVLALVLLALVAVQQGYVANQRRHEAESQRNLAVARQLAIEAEQLLGQNADLLPRSVLLGVEALRQNRGPEAEQAVRRGLALLPRRGAQIWTEGLTRTIASIAFGQEVDTLAVAGRDGIARWNTATGELLGHTAGVRVEALSRDGKTGVQVDGRTARVVAVLTGTEIARLPLGEKSGAATRAAYSLSADGRVLAAATAEGTIHAWALPAGSPLLTLDVSDRSGRRRPHVAVSPGGGQLAFAVGNEVELWSLVSRDVAGHFVHDERVVALALGPDGTRLAAALEGGAVQIWDAHAGTRGARLRHQWDAKHLVFTSDGRRLATASGVIARVWDAETGAEVFRIPQERGITAIALAADDLRLATAQGRDGLRIWDLASAGGGQSVPSGATNGVAISPDGLLLATAENDGLARLWDLDGIANGTAPTELRRFVHPAGGFNAVVTRVAFSPDESRLSAVVDAGTSIVWRLGDGTEASRLDTPQLSASIRLGPRGLLVAGSSETWKTEVWDLERGVRVAEIEHDASSWRPIVAPGGRHLAIKRRSQLLVFDIASGKQLAAIETGPETEILAVAFSTDAELVALGDDNATASVWRVADGARLALLPHAGPVKDVAFANDGAHLVTNGSGGVARVWEVSSGKVVAQLEHPAELVTLATDGDLVVTADTENRVRVWSIPSGRLEATRVHNDTIQLVSVSAATRTAGVAGKSSLLGFEIDSGRTLVERDFIARVTAFAHSPGGRMLAVGLAQGEVAVWDLDGSKSSDANPAFSAQFEGKRADLQDVAFSPDGKLLATAADATVHLWNTESGNELRRLDARGNLLDVAFSPDARYVAAGGFAGKVRVWEVETGTLVIDLEHDGMVSGVAFSPDSKLVAGTSYLSGTARVWRIADGSEVLRVVHTQGEKRPWSALLAAAFAPDGKQLATAGRDGDVRLWDLETGAEVGRLHHGSSVESIAFTRDGRRLLSAGVDHTARIWDISTGLTVSVVADEGPIRAAALHPDGQLIAVANGEPTVRLFNVGADWLAEEACRRIERNLTWQEWRQYFGPDVTYRKTCANLPLHPSFLEASLEMALAGDATGSRRQIEQAAAIAPELELDIEGLLLAHARHLDGEGVRLAKEGSIALAAQRFDTAGQLNTSTDYGSEARARHLAFAARLEEGVDHAKEGEVAEAARAYAACAELDPDATVPGAAWEALCWFGALAGKASDAIVIDACDRAVASVDPRLRGLAADSRGVARVLRGETADAIVDFQAFLAWAAEPESQELADVLVPVVAERRAWLDALNSGSTPLAGANPMDLGNSMTRIRMQLGVPWVWEDPEW